MKKLLTFALALVLMLSICPSMAMADEAGKIVLDVTQMHTRENWGDSTEAFVYLTLMDEFIAAHPEAEINVTGIPQADYHVRMMGLSAADDMPDVFFTKGSWVQAFYNSNLMADMTDDVDQEIYRDGIFVPFTRDNRIYATPIQLAVTSLVFYNKALWAEAGFDSFPDNWDDVFAADEAFKAKGITTISHGNLDRWPYESCILSALGDRFTGTDWTQGIILNDGSARFTDPEFVAALAFSQKMATLFNPDFNALTGEIAQSMFYNGEAATTIDGMWTISGFIANADPEVLEQIEITILPPVPDQKGQVNATSGGAGWGQSVSARLDGATLELAMELNNFVLGKRYSEMCMEHSGLLGPIEVPIPNLDAIPVLSQKYIKLMETVSLTPIYDIQMDGAVIDVMNSKLQDLLAGIATPEAVAEAIQAEQDKL